MKDDENEYRKTNELAERFPVPCRMPLKFISVDAQLKIDRFSKTGRRLKIVYHWTDGGTTQSWMGKFR